MRCACHTNATTHSVLIVALVDVPFRRQGCEARARGGVVRGSKSFVVGLVGHHLGRFMPMLEVPDVEMSVWLVSHQN